MRRHKQGRTAPINLFCRKSIKNIAPEGSPSQTTVTLHTVKKNAGLALATSGIIVEGREMDCQTTATCRR
jgi:hypothetical protein